MISKAHEWTFCRKVIRQVFFDFHTGESLSATSWSNKTIVLKQRIKTQISDSSILKTTKILIDARTRIFLEFSLVNRF